MHDDNRALYIVIFFIFVLAVVTTCGFFVMEQQAGREAGAREIVDAAALILEERPLEAVTLLEQALSRIRSQPPRSPSSASTWTYLLDTLGDAHHLCHNFNESFHFYSESLKYKLRFGRDVSELVESYEALAAAAQVVDPPAALGYLGQALDLPDLTPASRASVMWRQAKAYECAGDFEASLRRLEAMTTLDPKYGQDLTWRLLLMATLAKHVQAQEGPSGTLRSDLVLRLAGVKESLLTEGPWSDPQQMPPVSGYSAGLTAKPWHDLHDRAWERPVRVGGPTAAALLRDAADVVMASTAELRSEADDLDRAAKLRLQGECISSQRGGGWSFIEIESPWEEKGADGCILAAPVACALVKRLRDVGLPVVRAGYSAVEAGTRLLPHIGVTNRELKWHLGLRVPSTPLNCATLRVGNQSRSWQEGELLFFDDSFDHEVHNGCAEQRVVFQIVFRHVDLWGTQ